MLAAGDLARSRLGISVGWEGKLGESLEQDEGWTKELEGCVLVGCGKTGTFMESCSDCCKILVPRVYGMLVEEPSSVKGGAVGTVIEDTVSCGAQGSVG